MNDMRKQMRKNLEDLNLRGSRIFDRFGGGHEDKAAAVNIADKRLTSFIVNFLSQARQQPGEGGVGIPGAAGAELVDEVVRGEQGLRVVYEQEQQVELAGAQDDFHAVGIEEGAVERIDGPAVERDAARNAMPAENRL